jgi:hypothetical protein
MRRGAVGDLVLLELDMGLRLSRFEARIGQLRLRVCEYELEGSEIRGCGCLWPGVCTAKS